MGLFDYALNNFDPYQGGLLGALGANDTGGIARSYGGYQTPAAGLSPPSQRGLEKDTTNPLTQLWSALNQPPTTPGSNGEMPTQDGSLIRPGSFLASMFGNGAPTGVARAAPMVPGAMPSQAPAPAPSMPPMMPGIRPDQGGLPSIPPQQPVQPPQGMMFGGPNLPQSAMGGGYGGGVFPSQAQLPPNATPTQGRLAPQAQNAMAQQQPPMGASPGAGFGDRLSAAAANFNSGGNPISMLANVAQGLVSGDRFDRQGILQRNQAATFHAVYSSLERDGRYSPQQSYAIAQAASVNPDIAKAILPQALGPKEAPKTVTWKDENQIERTAFFDPKSAQYLDMQTGKPVQHLGVTPPGNSASPFSVGAIPPGVDGARWRQDEAARLADAEKELRTKGEGSLEFLPDAVRVMDKIKSGKYNNAIGPIQGGQLYNEYVRGYGGALDPTGAVRSHLGQYNELNADIKRLSSSNLKAQFGGRITNTEIGLNSATFGGAQSADPQTAYNILSERVKANLETIQRNVQAGFIKPSSVPPEVVRKGIEMGVLKPELFGAQPAPPADGWVHIGNGVRIREKK